MELELIQAEINTALAERKEEVSRLESARAALVGVSTTPTPRAGSKSKTTSKRRGRPPGVKNSKNGKPRKGSRGEQVLVLLQEKPGQTIPDLAAALKIEPNYLYRVMPNLPVEKDAGGRWSVTE